MSHSWDETGERCTKCGDKDWFAGPVCDGDIGSGSTSDALRNVNSELKNLGREIAKALKLHQIVDWLSRVLSVKPKS